MNAAPQLGDPRTMAELRHTAGLPMINSVPHLLGRWAQGRCEGGFGWELCAELEVGRT